MRTILLLTGIFLVLGSAYAQKKYLNIESSGVRFKIQKNQLTENQFNGMIKVLEADQLNTQFQMLDANTLVFNRTLVDHTPLNAIEQAIQSKINPFQTLVEYADLNQIPGVFLGDEVQTKKVMVSGLNTAADCRNLEKELLREKQLCFVHADHINHEVFIIFDVQFDDYLIKDMLRSQGKEQIEASELSKYY